MKPPTGWEGLLNKNEKILWQGTPSGYVKFPKLMLLGIFLFGFYHLIQMTTRLFDNNSEWVTSVLVVLFSIFLFFAVIWETINEHNKTWYTLTNKRAFIATIGLLRKKTIKFYPLTEFTEITFNEADPATILFAVEDDDNRLKGILDTGFKNIADGQKVYEMLQKIQKGAK